MLRRLGTTLVALLVLAAPAHAGPGDLDRTFGDHGRLTLTTTGHVAGAALPDGRRLWLSVQPPGARPAPLAVGLTAAGQVADRTRFPAPVTRAPRVADGHTLAEAGDGRLALAPIGGAPVVLTVPASTPFDLHDFGVDGAGRAVVFGSERGGRALAIRFLPDGALDTTYATGGVAELSGVAGFADAVVKRDGRAFVFGEETQMALDASGAPIAAYERSIVWPRALDPGSVATVADGPGDTVLIAGDGVDDNAFVARIASDGRPDRRFGIRGYVTGSPVLDRLTVESLIRDRHGRLLLGGAYYEARNRSKGAVLRFSGRGRPDTAFGRDGAKLLSPASRPKAWSVEHILVDARERIVVAGAAGAFSAPHPAIARLKG
ncbi:hypothetical protein OJ997_18605 [Solirubrobacter phytolaccae]|uniref:Delta-60 repeat domain-containing protein n=1 Tax=Solirubrobacter phytolaccae TaxID=1404360 RepID=A0A9X3NCG4_9ACTN|nr:hypothetical protein [Solirubrobacter phytolaccae]MDA0182325.1 hypothetical protein [Solirubrobacter phytolaccae]